MAVCLRARFDRSHQGPLKEERGLELTVPGSLDRSQGSVLRLGLLGRTMTAAPSPEWVRIF